MRAQSPSRSVHALDVSSLQGEGMYFWSAWENEIPVGCCALMTHGPTLGEIKSMHVLESHRGKGFAQDIFLHVENFASQLGLKWLSLETGSAESFVAARRFYEKQGFIECDPFASYSIDPRSCYRTKSIP